MKKLIAIMFGAALMFTACQQKDLEPYSVNGESGNVNITVYASDAISVRSGEFVNSALGGTSNVGSDYYLRYKLAVYTEDGTLVVAPQTNVVTSGGTNFNATLNEGETYLIVAWADFVTDQSGETDLHYDTSDLTAITYASGDESYLNDESRDAYYAAYEYTADGSSVSLTLHRPFAKLRLVATDWASVITKPSTISVTYSVDRYTAFNAMTEEASSAASTYTYTGTIDPDASPYTGGYDGSEYNYRTVSVDYILVGSEENDINLSYATYDGNGNELHSYAIEQDVPLVRNCLTTVIGKLLTTSTDADINVGIDDGFDDEFEISVGSISLPEGVTYTTIDGKSYPSIYEGGTLQLSANASDIVTASADDAWTWSSSDEDVATVDQTGLVTGVAGGFAMIYASCYDDDVLVKYCCITIYVINEKEPVTVTGGVSVEETSVKLPIDSDVYTIAFSEPDDVDQTLTWTSTDEDVVTVADGVITVVGFGDATVTVASNADEAEDGYALSAEIAVSVPKGYYNETCSGSEENFHWAGHKTNVASIAKNTNTETGESYYTITANNSQSPHFGYKTTGTSDFGTGDLDVYIDPINYPIVCFRFEDWNLSSNGGYRAITLDTIGYAESDTDKENRIAGSVGNNSNKWLSDYSKTCSDNSRIAVYNLAEQSIGSDTYLSEVTVFSTTWQIKYADLCSSSTKDSEYAVTDASWNFYWFKTFQSYDELNEFLSEWSEETGITFND